MVYVSTVYVIDRLTSGSGFAAMQPVERIGTDGQKRRACRTARVVARQHPGHWVQVRRGDTIVAPYEHHHGITRQV